MATKKKANEIRKTIPQPTDSALATSNSDDAIPAIFGNVEGVAAGMENVDSNDIILPRLALVQSMSQCVNSDDPSAPRPGEFINSLSVERFTPPVSLVALFYNKAAIRFAEKLSDPILCQSRDAKTGIPNGNCSNCDDYWNNWDDGPPQCSVIHEFVCVFSDEKPENAIPFVVSMMRSSAGTGKKWLSAAKFAGVNAPLFGVKYELGRDVKENDKGKFYVHTIKPCGRVEDPLVYVPLYQMVSGAYKSGRVVTEHDNAPDRIVEDDATGFNPDEL